MDSPAWPTCRRDDDCIGFRIDRADSCLAHLRAEEQIEFLRGLEPGGGLDLRGTPLTAELVARLVDAMYDGGASRAVLGSVRFEHAKFSGLVRFEGAEFGPAMFVDAEFDGSVDFTGCEFAGPVDFSEVAVRDRARFVEARFDGPSLFGIQANGLEMRGARFAHFVALRVTARTISCDQTRFEEGLSLLVEQGTVIAARAVFGAPSSIVGRGSNPDPVQPRRPEWLSDPLRDPQLLSLRGTDVSNLVLNHLDLSRCRFAGAHRLDQIRIEGISHFDVPPKDWLWLTWRHKRLVLAEESAWRTWRSAVPNDVGPEELAGLYRSLRKAFEDGKNEAGAGDFYYGEMEMRRHANNTKLTEKGILWCYWVLSGYGQRAGRALAALLILITTVGVLLVVWGQPPAEAAQIAIGAVVFRDPGTKLTEAGQWTVMVARFLGPVLLALAILAIRARVKR